MRKAARVCLTLLLAGSCLSTWIAAAEIARSPGLAPFVARSADEIVAVTDRMMTAEATPERIADLIAARLAEDPRNWIALNALRDEAEERNIALPPALAADLTAAHDQDHSPAALAADRVACLWDIAACTLSNVLVCKAPILMTPVEDIRGIAKAGWDGARGNPVDRLDLGLSIAGLGATALVVASGGSSATVKAGAGLARIARGMDLLSPRLAATMTDVLRAGVDWRGLARATGPGDIAAAVRTEALAPLATLASDLGRIAGTAGPTATLHLLRNIDTPADATRMADAAAALGPRAVARAEVLGPARLMRTTLRATRPAWQLLGGIAGLLVALVGFGTGLLQGAALRGLRRMVAQR